MDTELHKLGYNPLASWLQTSGEPWGFRWGVLSHQTCPRSLWTSPDSVPACIKRPGRPIGASPGPLHTAQGYHHREACSIPHTVLLTHGRSLSWPQLEVRCPASCQPFHPARGWLNSTGTRRHLKAYKATIISGVEYCKRRGRWRITQTPLGLHLWG